MSILNWRKSNPELSTLQTKTWPLARHNYLTWINGSGFESCHFHKIQVCARFRSLVLSGISEPQTTQWMDFHSVLASMK